MNVLLLTPIYPPTVGGAATNFNLLAKGLQKQSKIDNIYILTEYMKGEKIRTQNGKITILRLLYPKTMSKVRSKFRIFKEVLLMRVGLFFLLPLLCLIKKIDIIHLHATRFLIIRGHRNIPFSLVLKCLKYIGIKMVADAQDQIFLNVKGKKWGFDKLICISENIYKRALEGNDIDDDKCVYIPLPFERPNVDNISRPKAVANFVPYIFFGGGTVAENKGIYELIDAFKMLQNDYPNYYLVIAGPNMEGEKFMKIVENEPKICYLGPVSHEEMAGIMNFSELVISPSKSEGLPRTCLEAISLGKKVILPPGIGEFERYLPHCILASIDPKAIKLMLKDVLGETCTACTIKYPFEMHLPGIVAKRVVNLYAELLK